LSGMAAYKSPIALALMRRIKQAFDPAQIFNPGKTIPSESKHD
jgi:FAD/FMN-containing dehydrogenase